MSAIKNYYIKVLPFLFTISLIGISPIDGMSIVYNAKNSTNTGNSSLSTVCLLNSTKGLYLPTGTISTKCCKGKKLTPPQYSLPIYKTASGVNIVYLPNSFTCRVNVTRDNQEDDLPSLMWRYEACVIQNYLGKSEDEVDFQAFVDYSTTNYTEEDNLRSIIREANAECPDATKETELHKKVEAFDWCFHKNEEKICNEPTDEAKAYQANLTANVPKSCPIPKGLSKGHCCKGKSTPGSWIGWLPQPATPQEIFKNGTTLTRVIPKSYTKCMNASRVQSNRKANDPLYLCHNACNLNPVVFKNETEGPEVHWNFSKALESYYKNFNQAIVKDLTEISLKLRPGFKAFFDGKKYSNKPNGTEILLDEIEKEYLDVKDPVKKVNLYCSYYNVLALLAQTAFWTYCYPDEHN